MAGEASIEVLPRDECLELLQSATIGRIAYCAGDEARIVPVNFLVYYDEVVVRTSYGGKLAAAVHGAVMTFQVDHADPRTRTGWAVTVTGQARFVDRLEDVTLLDIARLEPWAPGDMDFYVAIDIEAVTGRRIRRSPNP
jgi:nitroimidazol reductase NimA-like FMN-containing flavoprotein (pyridoxamine 5'-phosphate oxidase superfamily)